MLKPPTLCLLRWALLGLLWTGGSRTEDALCSHEAQRLGVCHGSSHLLFQLPMTLPAGGASAEAKLNASVPGRSQSATFFFARNSPLNSLPAVFQGTPGVGFAFECRLQRQPAFDLCRCSLPPSDSYEGCHRVDGLQAAGQEALYVRMVPLSEGQRQQNLAAPAALYLWTQDAIAPETRLGQHMDLQGALQQRGPPPCLRPSSAATIMEVESNEFPVAFQCRHAVFNPALGAFEGFLEAYTAVAVDNWVLSQMTQAQLANHLSLAQAWSSLRSLHLNGTDLLALADSDLRLLLQQQQPDEFPPLSSTLLRAIQAHRLPWTACGTSQAGEIALVTLDEADLAHGLHHFQARAVDAAGNTGDAAAYIFFADTTPGKVLFRDSPLRTQEGAILVRWDTSDGSGDTQSFMDHLGRRHDCSTFLFQLHLDGYDITPQAPPAALQYTSSGIYQDNMDARFLETYNYRRYRGDTSPLLSGKTRQHVLQVTPVDVAGIPGDVATYAWIQDRRVPQTRIFQYPQAAVAPGSLVSFAWADDESSVVHTLQQSCRLGTALATCPNQFQAQFQAGNAGETQNATIVVVDGAGNRAQVLLAPESNLSWTVEAAPPALPRLLQPVASHTTSTRFAVALNCGAAARVQASLALLATPEVAWALPYVAQRAEDDVGLEATVTVASATTLPLPDGHYLLRVTGVSRAQQIGPALELQFVVDTVAPRGAVSTLPALPSHRRTAQDWIVLKIAELSDDAEAQSECALDCSRLQLDRNSCPPSTCGPTAFVAAPGTSLTLCNETEPVYLPCGPASGNVTLRGLAEGPHRFYLRQRDAAGNVGEPAILRWLVDRSPPNAQFLPGPSSRPPSVGSGSVARFEFSASEALTTFRCRLLCVAMGKLLSVVEENTLSLPLLSGPEAAAPDCSHILRLNLTQLVPCESPVVYSDLPSGGYLFQVTATDAAGNAQATATALGTRAVGFTSHTFSLDNLPPAVQLLRAPAALTNLPVETIHATASEPGVLACEVCRRTDRDPTACELVFPCSLPLSVTNVRAPSEYGPLVQDGQLVLCPLAQVAGCQPHQWYQGLGRCQVGILQLCGLEPISASPFCQRSEAPASEYAKCARTFPYYHTVFLTATDSAGNTGDTVNITWRYDAELPVVALEVIPITSATGNAEDVLVRPYWTGSLQTRVMTSGFVTSRPEVTARFQDQYLSSAMSDVQAFHCELRTPTKLFPFFPCSSPLHLPEAIPGLTNEEGFYALTVRAEDEAGNLSPSETREWLLEQGLPRVHFLREPAAVPWMRVADVGLSFACSKPLCDFECRISSAQATLHNLSIVSLPVRDAEMAWEGTCGRPHGRFLALLTTLPADRVTALQALEASVVAVEAELHRLLRERPLDVAPVANADGNVAIAFELEPVLSRGNQSRPSWGATFGPLLAGTLGGFPVASVTQPELPEDLFRFSPATALMAELGLEPETAFINLTFEVRGSADGVVGEWFPTYFLHDTVAPEVFFTAGPWSVVKSGSEVAFAFWASGHQGFSQFEFELGRMSCEATACQRSALRNGVVHGIANVETLVSEASLEFHGLDPGKYEFSVAAVDLAGNRGTPRLYAFDIVGEEATPLVLVGAFQDSEGVLVSFAGTPPFQCVLVNLSVALNETVNNFAWLPCASPVRVGTGPQVLFLQQSNATFARACLDLSEDGSASRATGCTRPTNVAPLVLTSNGDTCTTRGQGLVAALVVMALLTVVGVAVLAALLYRAHQLPPSYLRQPRFKSKRAFHNPAFAGDLPDGERTRSRLKAGISGPTNFQHLASGNVEARGSTRPGSNASHGSSGSAGGGSGASPGAKVLPKRKRAITPHGANRLTPTSGMSIILE